MRKAISAGLALMFGAAVGFVSSQANAQVLAHQEGGFDFVLFDNSDVTTPFFVGSGDGGRSLLGFCPGCFVDDPNILRITRPDGNAFSIISLLGSSFDEPVDAQITDDDTFQQDFVLQPNYQSFGFDTPFATEVLIFSPLPFNGGYLDGDDTDAGEAGDCICIDQILFAVDFPDEEEVGVNLFLAQQSIETVLVTFGDGPNTADTPEPATLGLLGASLVGLGWLRRRRRT